MKICTKVAFRSKQDALDRLRAIVESPDSSRLYAPNAVVSCKRCECWHLTSKNGKPWRSGKLARNSATRSQLEY
jgi:hypothetical protein